LRFWMEQVRDAPAGIALAAGRHHITNFDADSARNAASAGGMPPLKVSSGASRARLHVLGFM
jgi:hypothetical protein